MTSRTFNRRQLFRYGGAAAIGLTATRAMRAKPALARTAGAEIGSPVGGTWGNVYGRIGTPRGLQLGFTANTATSRTVTWLTTGEVDPGSVVQFGVVPIGASEGDLRTGSFLDREIRGSSQMAPFG